MAKLGSFDDLPSNARGFLTDYRARLDIMSEAEGQVGAETFAVVSPRNNGKLAADLEKMARRPELHRYVFFMSPRYPKAERLPQFERDGVQVWSVAV